MKVEAPFIHLIKLHTKYYLYDVNSKMIVNISNDLFDFFKSNENIKAEIEIPHKLEDEVRRLLKYDLFSKTDTGYEIEYPQGTNLEEILNNCMRIMTLQVRAAHAGGRYFIWCVELVAGKRLDCAFWR